MPGWTTGWVRPGALRSEGRAWVPVVAALVCAMAAPQVQAQNGGASQVTVYGLVDLGVEVSRAGQGRQQRLISGGSSGNRLGFQGREDLGSGWAAQFRLEQGFNADDGFLAQGGRAFGRESSVGLASRSWGTLSMGRIPLPYYLGLSGIDAFAWTGSGGMLSLSQSGAASRQLLPLAISARADNAVSYVAPQWGGLEWRLLAAMGEKSATLGRLYSTSLRYRAGPWDGVAAWGRQYGAHDAAGAVNAWTLGGSYATGRWKLYAGGVQETNDCTTCTGALARSAGVGGRNASAFRMLNLGARFAMGPGAVYAQVTRVYDRSRYAVDPGNRNATWLAVGGEYALSKRTLVYGTLASIGNQHGSHYALGSGTAQQPAGAVGPRDPRATTAVLGVRHRF